MRNRIAKWMQIERRITAIRERYVDDASLNNALLSEADWYSKLFGEGNFYIELQYHGLEIEKAAYPKLAWVAQMTGLRSLRPMTRTSRITPQIPC